MDQEITRRGRIGATSASICFRDIGVTWDSRENMYCQNFPGLSSLYTIRPEWFNQKGDTSVSQVIAHIASDPSL